MVSYDDLHRRAYDMYRLDWMLSHRIGLDELFGALSRYKEDSGEDGPADPKGLFEDLNKMRMYAVLPSDLFQEYLAECMHIAAATWEED